MSFVDRRQAGEQLAARLGNLRGQDAVVLALPRGGVPVAAAVAAALHAPLDVIVVRKLGVPFQPELGMGAIGEGGVRILNQDVIRSAGIRPDELDEVEATERRELDRRARTYRGTRSPVGLTGRTAVVVDDGLATGATAHAACQVARARGARRVVLAVPVAPAETVELMRDVADEVHCLESPEPFYAIGLWYQDFTQVTDEEVSALLTRAATDPGRGHEQLDPGGAEAASVQISVAGVRLSGLLNVPAGAVGKVVFVHGSGSSRRSPRNQFVAEVLNRAGLATLLFDLLTEDEELDRGNVFDIELLAGRLVLVANWLQGQASVAGLRTGYFGASTGAAAALWAAAEPGADIAAVVSRGGRPDLAGERLAAVLAPTLLIVGGEDDLVLDLNRRAQARLRCTNHLVIVPRATHLFVEPGTLQVAADQARDWFVRYLGSEPGH